MNGYPGLDHKVLTYSQNRISEVLAPSRRRSASGSTGRTSSVLQEKAAEVRQVLSGIDGAEDVRVQRIVTEPTIEIEVDLPKAQAAGIKPGDVRRAATTLVSGIQVGALFEEQKIFEVQVWGTPEVRRSVSDVENLLLDLPDGGHVTPGRGGRRAHRLVADVDRPRRRRRAASTSPPTSADASRRCGRRRPPAAAGRRSSSRSSTTPRSSATTPTRRARSASWPLFVLGAAIGIFLLLQAAFASWRLALAGFAGLLVAVGGGVRRRLDRRRAPHPGHRGRPAGRPRHGRAPGLELVVAASRLERDEGRPLSRDLVQPAPPSAAVRWSRPSA